MLSHDNYVWTAKMAMDADLKMLIEKNVNIRAVSYLPLSHVAAQYADIFLTLANGASVFFTDANALRGTLIDYLLEVKPVIFLGVPRIYEKMEEKVRAALEKKPFIYKWATHYGKIGTDLEMKNKAPPVMFNVINKIVFNKVKQQLGLDECVKFFSGAAPLPMRTRDFFFNLNIFINNTFGMSETSGPMTSMLKEDHPWYDLTSAGRALPGTEVVVVKADPNAESGELCFRGRNIFMGYLKNEQATRDCIDNQRRVHSGDEGKVSPTGMMTITGRIKELLVTAGGENVAPVIMETLVKEELPILSNVVCIGDQMKYIAALLTLKVTSNANELPNHQLTPEAVEWLQRHNVKDVTTVQDAIQNKAVQKLIQDGIDRANKKAVSNAAKIKAWQVIPDDFSIPGGEFTPTLKMKRSVITKKYAKNILDIYSRPEL
jgi:long-chain-fatty-acid--CoA ligase ACSBG